MRWANRPMLARISSADFVQTKGLPLVLCASMNSRIAASSAGDASMHAAPQLLGGQLGEPALNEVQPGPVGRGEVDVEPRSFSEPRSDERGLSQMQLGLHGLLVVCLTNGFTLPGRGIPPAGVAPRSNTTGMLPGRALSAGRRARQVRNAILRHTTRCGRPASCRVARRSEQEGRYLHLAAFEGGQERVDDLRVELGAGPIDQDLTDLVRGHRLAIGTVARQRVEDVRD